MSYVALVPLLFGEARILPGEPVPFEEGRRYDLMEFAREIQSVPGETPVTPEPDTALRAKTARKG